MEDMEDINSMIEEELGMNEKDMEKMVPSNDDEKSMDNSPEMD